MTGYPCTVSVERTKIRMMCASFNYSVNVFDYTAIILFQILQLTFVVAETCTASTLVVAK